MYKEMYNGSTCFIYTYGRQKKKKKSSNIFILENELPMFCHTKTPSDIHSFNSPEIVKATSTYSVYNHLIELILTDGFISSKFDLALNKKLHICIFFIILLVLALTGQLKCSKVNYKIRMRLRKKQRHIDMVII